MNLRHKSWLEMSGYDFRLFLLLVLMVLAIAVRHPAMIAGYVLMSFYLAYENHRSFSETTGYDRFFALLVVASCTLMLPLALYRNPNSAFHYITVIAGLLSAVAIVSRPHEYLKCLGWLLVASQASVLAFLFFRGFDDFPLDTMLESSSSNGITSSIICIQVCYSVACICLYRRTTLVTTAITLFISVVGFGRGSIVASGILVILNSSYIIFSQTNKAIKAIYSAAIFILLIYAVINIGAIIDYLNQNTKIGSGLFDVERYIINKDYSERLSGINVIIGVDYKNTVIERFYNGNPHNSFIRAHNIFGIFYVSAIALATICAFFQPVSRIVRAYSAALIGILLIRGYTEPILFPTPFDTIYIASLLIIRNRSQGTSLASTSRTSATLARRRL